MEMFAMRGSLSGIRQCDPTWVQELTQVAGSQSLRGRVAGDPHKQANGCQGRTDRAGSGDALAALTKLYS